MSVLEVFIRIVIAAGLAGLIGLEREIREHTAGFRTHILVAVGAAAFTIASIYGVEGTAFDPNRISAGIVTGMGFLGAGAIIRYGLSVRGLTTASSLWAVAAVGLLAGQGFYEAALVTAGVVVVSLYGLRVVEDKILFRLTEQPVEIRVRFRGSGYEPLVQLTARLREMHVEIREMSTDSEEGKDDSVRLSLRLPRRMTTERLVSSVAELGGVCSVEPD